MATTYVRRPSTLPLGVGILAVLIGIVGALFLIASLILFLVLFIASPYHFATFAVFGLGLLGAVLLLIFGIILLVVATGLWDLHMWALVVSFIVIGIAWVSDILQGGLSAGFLTIGGLILLGLLVYLFLVRKHFS